MTQYIYLASPMKLPKGSFGSNPVSSYQPNIFRTELDFTHLYFENNYDSEIKCRFSYSSHFSYKYQVAACANQIPLKNQIRGTTEKEKCLTILYAYIDEVMQNSQAVEYFTSLNGEENLALFRKRSIHWPDIKSPYDLVLEDREFWEIFL
ncbi:hypothetical protein [Oceanobacillus jeddahense]|uniref:hypothetical protein n=1 Tax=Oceanobacillus jeddahense TaxID=1462527 RepID=UPI000595C8BC|nr:hypothetical protein [Oceanobacillus jeddahense]